MRSQILNYINKNFLEFLPFILVFLSSLYRPYDADLGWHLKYGEYFFKTGQILRDNIFSTEMVDYKWVNHSWATDLLTYAVYNGLGFFGISLLGATVLTLTFYFFSKASKLDLWEKALIFPLILYFVQPVSTVSFRGQLLTVLFLGVLFYLLTLYEGNPKSFAHKDNLKPKVLFLVVPLFLIWANFHGGFLIGLAFLTGFIILSFLTDLLESGIKSWKETLVKYNNPIFVLLGSILVTLINPWGYGIFLEAYKHSVDPNLRLVKEWLPFEDLSAPWWNHYIAGILVFFGTVFYFFNGVIKEKLPNLGLTYGLLFASVWVRRHAWPFYYLSMDSIKPIAEFFKPESDKTVKITSIVILTLSIAITTYIKWPIQKYPQMDWQIYCSEYNGCSSQAAQYLINNKLTDNLFTIYNWGGWLIWNYPQIKPTVDGRMHLWRDEKGYSGFEYFYQFEQDLENIDKGSWDVAFVPPNKNVYQRLEKLMKEGKWRRVYRDEFASIFIRIKNNSN